MEHINKLAEAAKREAEMIINSANKRAQRSEESQEDNIWLGFDFYHPDLMAAKKIIVDWYNFGIDTGRAIVLYGNCGCGKTHLARVVAQHYMQGGASLYSEPDLLDDLRSTYSGDGSEKQIIRNVRNVQLLILDDIGAGYVNNTEWLEGIYWRILDKRTEMQKPLMITTNLSRDNLFGRIGERATSRLLGMLRGNKERYIDLTNVPDYRLRES